VTADITGYNSSGWGLTGNGKAIMTTDVAKIRRKILNDLLKSFCLKRLEITAIKIADITGKGPQSAIVL
jgi:hypothetical protein